MSKQIPARRLAARPRGEPLARRKRANRPRRLPAVALFSAVCAPVALADGADFACTRSGADAMCTFAVSPGPGIAPISFTAARGNILALPDGSGYELTGDIAIVTGQATIPLASAQLFLTYGDSPFGGIRRVGGRAYVPFPADSFLGPLEMGELALAEIGLDLGSNLEHLGAHLNPERPCNGQRPEDPDFAECPYVFFNFQTGISGNLGGIGFSVPGGQGATFVLDPFDPYFYLAGSLVDGLNSLGAGGEAAADAGGATGSTGGGDGGAPGGGTSAGGDTGGADTGGEEGAQASGFGFSLNGLIPFEAENTFGLPSAGASFLAHLVVDAEIPLPEIPLTIDGSVYYRLPVDPATGHVDPGLTIGGNGDLLVSFPFMEVLDLSLHVASASVYLSLGEDGTRGFFSGDLPDPLELIPIRLPFAPSHRMQVAGSFGDRLEDNYIQAEGELTVSLGRLGPVALPDLGMATASLRISPEGFFASGVANLSFHPLVGLDGGLDVRVEVPAAAPQASRATLAGALSIAGIALGSQARAEVDATGARIDGSFRTPLSLVTLRGELTESDARLAGTTRVSIPLDGMRRALEDARRALASAQARVATLDREIANTRATVQAERQRDLERLRAAREGLRAAQSRVAALDGDIAWHNGMIAHYQREINAKWHWANSQPWYNQIWAWPAYGAFAAERGGRIAYHWAMVQAASGARAIAWGVLEGAARTVAQTENAVRAVQSLPVDADPRVATLIGARVLAGQTLAGAQLALPPIAGLPDRADAQVNLTLSRAGISGQTRADLCYQGQCQRVANGRVTFGARPQACIALPLLPEACAAF